MELDRVRNPQAPEMEEVKARVEVGRVQAVRLAAIRAAVNERVKPHN
jgi:hypothetical protein